MMLLDQTVQAAERSLGAGDPWIEALLVERETASDREPASDR
jgi:hypothetical protein